MIKSEDRIKAFQLELNMAKQIYRLMEYILAHAHEL